MSIEMWALKPEHWFRLRGSCGSGHGWKWKKGDDALGRPNQSFYSQPHSLKLVPFFSFFLVSVFRCCSWYAATGHIFCTQAILRPRSSFGINKVDCGLPSYPKKYKGHGHSAQVPNCSSGYPDTPWITKSYTDRFLIYTWNLSKIRINYTISLQLHCCCTGMQLAGMTVSIHTYYTGKYTHENKRWPGDLWRLRTWVRLT